MSILLTWLPVWILALSYLMTDKSKELVTRGRVVPPVVNAFQMLCCGWFTLALAIRLTQPEEAKCDFVLAAIVVTVLFVVGAAGELWRAFRNNRYNAFYTTHMEQQDAFRHLLNNERYEFLEQAKKVRFNRKNWGLALEDIAVKLYAAAQTQTDQ